MPFENAVPGRKKIAVIGAGISGMGAARYLAEDHDVTLIEAEPRLGGHARTVVAGKNGDQPVDTGFIVFNYTNYPHMTALFEELDVPVTKSNMSFGASLAGGRVEYGLASLGALFAQKRNAANPAFLRMIRDIMRFNAKGLATAQADPDMTVGQMLERLGTGPWFRDYYITPLSGAIWSTPTEKILDFPAYAMMRFFENHALLSATGQHQWYTVDGGSIQYVTRLERKLTDLGVTIRLGCPIDTIRRVPGGVEIKAQGDWETFDEVVMATHSDVSLRLLSDPSEEEHAALSDVRYQPNDIILHADTSVMPKRRACWSSWVYTEAPGKSGDCIDMTYWMNSLQPIPQNDPMFVTLNSTKPIREDLIYDRVTLDHPVYDLGVIGAQQAIRDFNGTHRTWFCGAWMKNGFHEDGLASAVDVVRAMREADMMPVAAE